MIYLIPALIVFSIELYLFVAWLKQRQKEPRKAKIICFLGFLLGQLYILWEVMLVKQTGIPLPESPEKKMLMLRIVLGGAMGGLFTIIGLFYLSFASYKPLNTSEQEE